MKIKLLSEHVYPAAWVPNRIRYPKGSIVNAIVADNLPEKGYWIDEPELRNDPYGIHVSLTDCEVISE